MNLDEFLEYVNSGKKVKAGSDVHKMFHTLSQDALKITMELNNKYHTSEEIVEIFSKLTGKKIDSSFGLFPPFYTDCGKNITVGKNVFINACCRFQDQGGITIDDNVFIGHNVTISTINHNFAPEHRADMYPKAVKIGKNVWIGADSTILPGVSIKEGAIVGAGSIVNKDVLSNTIVAGNPAKVIKNINRNKNENNKSKTFRM